MPENIKIVRYGDCDVPSPNDEKSMAQGVVRQYRKAIRNPGSAT